MLVAYRESFHFEAPVAKVFAFFADPTNYGQAEPEQIEFKDVVVTDQGVGTHYAWSTKIAGIPLEGFDVFTEYEQDRSITDKSSLALEGTWTYTFEPEGSGTRLTVENHVRSVWNLPPLRQLLALAAGRSHRPRFQRVREALETEGDDSTHRD